MADLPPLPPPAERRKRFLVYGIALVVMVILAVAGWRLFGSGDGDASKTQSADGKGGKAGQGKGAPARAAGASAAARAACSPCRRSPRRSATSTSCRRRWARRPRCAR
jgi:hypothetical protein